MVSLAGCVLGGEALAELVKGLSTSTTLQQLDLRRKDQVGGGGRDSPPCTTCLQNVAVVWEFELTRKQPPLPRGGM